MAKILVIDDDAVIRRTFNQALTKAGHDVRLSDNGREAIRQQRNDPVNVLIVDLFMPEQDGLETITQFHREFPHVTIIAMSGGYAVSGTMLSVAQELGATRVLEKPFDSAVLLQCIEEALQEA